MLLDQIVEQAEYNNKYYREQIVKVRKIGVYNGTVSTDKETFNITEGAMGQLLEKLDIKTILGGLDRKFVNEESEQTALFPRKYRTKEGIVKDIVKLGIRKQRNPFKFIYDSNLNIVKGVVGANYERVPNATVLESSQKVYGDKIDPRFSYINDRLMKLYYESDTEKLAPISNERLMYGYTVGNSETGWGSLSVKKAITFLQCTNGLEMGKIAEGSRFYHTTKELVSKFKRAMDKHLNDESLIAIIDAWATKPPMFDYDSIEEYATVKKLDNLLSRFGVNKEEYRKAIINIIKTEDRDKPINSFKIGSAVNNYASNHLKNEMESQLLLVSAFNVMNIQ